MALSTSTYLLGAALALAGLATPSQAQAQTTVPAWQSAVLLSDGPALGYDIAVDKTGNSYELGRFSGTAVVAGTTLVSKGGDDVYLAKYTPTGVLAWIRQIGSTGSESGMAVALDAAGNVYVTGSFGQNISLGNGLTLTWTGAASFSARKMYVVRYSPQGTPEWAQQSLATASGTPAGSGIGFDAAGDVYVSGLASSQTTIGTTTLTSTENGGFFTFVARFANATGELQFLRKGFDYKRPQGAYFYPKMAVSAQGEVYVATAFNQDLVADATTYFPQGIVDVLVVKYTAAGSQQWVQQFGGRGEDNLADIVVDATGNAYVAGYFTGPATFGTLPGATTLPGAGLKDGFLAKLTSTGTLAWAQALGGASDDVFYNLALDAAGNPYVAGSFTNTALLGTTQLTSAGNADIVVAAYSPQGQLRWARSAGGPASDLGIYMDLGPNNDLYVLGRTSGACTFDSHTLAAPTTAPATFLARLGTATLATQAARPRPLALFPNPATSHVMLPALPVGTPVQLLDALGRVVRATVVSATATVSVQGLQPGLYTLRAIDAQGQPYSGRVVVE